MPPFQTEASFKKKKKKFKIKITAASQISTDINKCQIRIMDDYIMLDYIILIWVSKRSSSSKTETNGSLQSKHEATVAGKKTPQ